MSFELTKRIQKQNRSSTYLKKDGQPKKVGGYIPENLRPGYRELVKERFVDPYAGLSLAKLKAIQEKQIKDSKAKTSTLSELFIDQLIRLMKELKKNGIKSLTGHNRTASLNDYKIILEELNRQFQEIGVTITDKFVRDFLGRLMANSKDKMLTEYEMYDDALNYAINLHLDSIYGDKGKDKGKDEEKEDGMNPPLPPDMKKHKKPRKGDEGAPAPPVGDNIGYDRFEALINELKKSNVTSQKQIDFLIEKEIKKQKKMLEDEYLKEERRKAKAAQKEIDDDEKWERANRKAYNRSGADKAWFKEIDELEAKRQKQKKQKQKGIGALSDDEYDSESELNRGREQLSEKELEEQYYKNYPEERPTLGKWIYEKIYGKPGAQELHKMEEQKEEQFQKEMKKEKNKLNEYSRKLAEEHDKNILKRLPPPILSDEQIESLVNKKLGDKQKEMGKELKYQDLYNRELAKEREKNKKKVIMDEIIELEPKPKNFIEERYDDLKRLYGREYADIISKGEQKVKDDTKNKEERYQKEMGKEKKILGKYSNELAKEQEKNKLRRKQEKEMRNNLREPVKAIIEALGKTAKTKDVLNVIDEIAGKQKYTDDPHFKKIAKEQKEMMEELRYQKLYNEELAEERNWNKIQRATKGRKTLSLEELQKKMDNLDIYSDELEKEREKNLKKRKPDPNYNNIIEEQQDMLKELERRNKYSKELEKEQQKNKLRETEIKEKSTAEKLFDRIFGPGEDEITEMDRKIIGDKWEKDSREQKEAFKKQGEMRATRDVHREYEQYKQNQENLRKKAEQKHKEVKKSTLKDAYDKRHEETKGEKKPNYFARDFVTYKVADKDLENLKASNPGLDSFGPTYSVMRKNVNVGEKVKAPKSEIDTLLESLTPEERSEYDRLAEKQKNKIINKMKKDEEVKEVFDAIGIPKEEMNQYLSVLVDQEQQKEKQKELRAIVIAKQKSTKKSTLENALKEQRKRKKQEDKQIKEQKK